MVDVNALNRPARGLAGLALPAAAAAVLVALLLHPLPSDNMQTTGGLIATHPFWGAAHVLHLIGGLVGLGGFVALGLALRPTANRPTVPLLGAGLAAVGFLLHFGAGFIELAVAPGYAVTASAGSEVGQASLLGAHTTALTLAVVGNVMLAAGGLLLASALARVDGLPRWMASVGYVLLPVAALVSLVALTLGEPARNLLVILGALATLLWAAAVGASLLARQRGEPMRRGREAV